MVSMTFADRMVAAEWVGLATARPVSDILDLELADSQLKQLAWWLHENPRVKMLFKMEGGPRVKVARYYCACQCGEWVAREYRTKKPKYKNDYHKLRAYRIRKRNRLRSIRV
jgi:hypothetical protein